MAIPSGRAIRCKSASRSPFGRRVRAFRFYPYRMRVLTRVLKISGLRPFPAREKLGIATQ